MDQSPLCSLADLVRAVEAIAPRSLAEPWDHIGLQVGHPGRPVRRVMTCLEVTPPVLAEAARRHADALVAHHPLFFQPLEALNLAQPVGDLTARLVKEDRALVVAHTNLDAAAEGTNAVLAAACGLEPTGPLAAREGGGGMGLVAALPSPLPLAEWVAQVKQRLGLEGVRVSGPEKKKIRRVAICSGSGGSFLGLVAGRAEVYLTGEINYHHAVEAHARGIAVVELGHFESERLVVEPLARLLAADERLARAKVEVLAAQCDLQPFRMA